MEVCFGIPGGAVLPLYDALARGTSVRHILARHEQGAGHMAEGYARASGRPGVVIATSGPGATNLVTPIADARMDSTPLVCITGQVRSNLIGTDAFQECDIVSVTAPLVKSGWQVRDPDHVFGNVVDAVWQATTGRFGPVIVDIPRDVQELPAAGGSSTERAEPALPSPNVDSVWEAAQEIARASAPVLYIGGGVIRSGAAAAVRELAETAGIPVVTTLMAKGAFPDSHQLCMGAPGMHGSKYANWALNRADLVIALGARFDDRVTGRPADFARDARVIHFDVDPREIGKIRKADVGVAGDLRANIEHLVLELTQVEVDPDRYTQWRQQVFEWRTEFPYSYARSSSAIKPQSVVESLRDHTRGRDDVIFTTGVGKHQMWAMQYLVCDGERQFITSGGLATMGFGLPAAIGAKAARPDCTVICIDGDGSVQMTIQEIATSLAEDLPVVVVVLNDGALGMVRQWQTMFFDGRLSQVGLDRRAPDFAALARAHGALGITVTNPADLDSALGVALASEITTIVDVHVDPDEPCYPMIPPGAAAVDVIDAEDVRRAREATLR